MSVKRQPFEAVHDVGKTVAARIQINVVDLVRVSGQNHLRSFARAADYRLYLMRREVLRLVDDHKLFRNAASSDVGKRFQFKFARPLELVDLAPHT